MPQKIKFHFPSTYKNILRRNFSNNSSTTNNNNAFRKKKREGMSAKSTKTRRRH